MITNFPINPMFNVGGAAAFQFSPMQSVSFLPTAVNKKIITPVGFKSFGSFLTGYATLETLQFTETPRNDENGAFYTWLITGFMPGDSDELVSLMENMEATGQYIVVVKDMMGLSRLVGYQAPLIFTADYSPGNDTRSARGYTFTFSGAGPRRAPVYAPAS